MAIMVTFPIAGADDFNGLGFSPYKIREYSVYSPVHDFSHWKPEYKDSAGSVMTPDVAAHYDEFYNARIESMSNLLDAQGFTADEIKQMLDNYNTSHGLQINWDKLYPPPDVLYISFINAALNHPVDRSMELAGIGFRSVLDKYNDWILNNPNSRLYDYTPEQLTNIEIAYQNLLTAWENKLFDGYTDIVVNFNDLGDPFFQAVVPLFNGKYSIEELQKWNGNDLLAHATDLFDNIYNSTRGILISDVVYGRPAPGFIKGIVSDDKTVDWRYSDGSIETGIIHDLDPYDIFIDIFDENGKFQGRKTYNPNSPDSLNRPDKMPAVFQDDSAAFPNAVMAKTAEALDISTVPAEVTEVLTTEPKQAANWFRQNKTPLIIIGTNIAIFGLAATLYAIFASHDESPTNQGTTPIDPHILDDLNNKKNAVEAKKKKALEDLKKVLVQPVQPGPGPGPAPVQPKPAPGPGPVKPGPAPVQPKPGPAPVTPGPINPQSAQLEPQQAGMSTGAKVAIGVAVAAALGLGIYALTSNKRK